MDASTRSLFSPYFEPCPPYRTSHNLFPVGHPRLVLPVHKMSWAGGMRFFLPLSKRILGGLQDLLSSCQRKKKATGYCETEMFRRLKEFSGFPESHAAVSLGTPGPFNKKTVLFMTPAGAIMAIAKVGLNAATRNLLQNEARWLDILGRQAVFCDQIPILISQGEFDKGYVVVQSANQSRRVGNSFNKMHGCFLAILQGMGQPSQEYAGSEMARSMQNRYLSYKNKMQPSLQKQMETSLDVLQIRFGAITLPMVAAHRDFVPWNMRRNGGRLFVYDWEYASCGYMPLYDVFHFLLMPLGVKRKITPTNIARAIETAIHIGKSYLGNNKTSLAYLQVLAYLLDVWLFYFESIDGADIDHPVLASYGRMINIYYETQYDEKIFF